MGSRFIHLIAVAILGLTSACAGGPGRAPGADDDEAPARKGKQAAGAGSTTSGDGSSHEGIVGGTETMPNDVAGVVALRIDGYLPSCGGSLVAADWVLTAAHCITPGKANGGIDEVVIARHRLSSKDGETRTVVKAIVHPDYDDKTTDNDLALLHLSAKTIALTSTLVTAAQARSLAGNVMTTVVGWGNTTQDGKSSDVLRQVSIPAIPNAECSKNASYAGVTDNMICAGVPEGGKDSCQGDSGGPLFVDVGGKLTQFGIVSWGAGCAKKGAPGVYTRISNYLGWINTTTGGALGENMAEQVALSWPKRSSTAEYSLDVQLPDGEWLWPCVDAGTLGTKLAYSFDGMCSAHKRNVSVSGLRSFRICWAENGDWPNGKCEAIPFDGQKTALKIAQ